MRVEIQSSDLSEGKKNALMRSSASTLAVMLKTFSNRFSNGLLRGHRHWRVHDIFGGTDIGCRKRTGRQAKQNLLLLQRCDFCVLANLFIISLASEGKVLGDFTLRFFFFFQNIKRLEAGYETTDPARRLAAALTHQPARRFTRHVAHRRMLYKCCMHTSSEI
jgi:hypothetical protein